MNAQDVYRYSYNPYIASQPVLVSKATKIDDSKKIFEEWQKLAVNCDSIAVKSQFLDQFFKSVYGDGTFDLQESWYKDVALSVFEVIETMSSDPVICFKYLNMASEKLSGLSGKGSIASNRANDVRNKLLQSIETGIHEGKYDNNESALIPWLLAFTNGQDMGIRIRAISALREFIKRGRLATENIKFIIR